MSIALNVETAIPPWTELARGVDATVLHGPESVHTPERDWLELFAEFAQSPAAVPCERIARLLCLTFRSTACSYSRVVDGAADDGMIWSHDDWIIDLPRALGPPRGDATPEAVGAAALRAWDDLGPPIACPDRLSLPVLLPRSGPMAFVLGRDGPYGSAESRLAETLWSLLATLDGCIAGSSTAARRPAAVSLTPRELDVLQRLAAGLTAVAIAHRLSISVRTVHKHLERVYEKLGVTDRLAAVLAARRKGLIAG